MFKKSGMRTPSIAFETFLINIMFKFFSHLIMLQYLRSSWPTLGSQGVYFWRRAIITGSTLAANTARAQHRLIGRQTWAKAGASFSAQSQGSQDKPILGQDWPKRQHADWEDHQTWQELLDPTQGHNHARLKASRKQSSKKLVLKFFFFCQIRKHVNYLLSICGKVKKYSLLSWTMPELGSVTRPYYTPE